MEVPHNYNRDPLKLSKQSDRNTHTHDTMSEIGFCEDGSTGTHIRLTVYTWRCGCVGAPSSFTLVMLLSAL